MSSLLGATCTPVGNSEAISWLAWLRGEAERPCAGPPLCFALAHCDDGVTWGRFDKEVGRWQLGSAVFPDLCPKPARTNLRELRMFGSHRELLLWRGEGGLQGRWLADAPGAGEVAPRDEVRILLGDYVLETRDGFTRVRSRAGEEQALPLVCRDEDLQPAQRRPRLAVRSYYAQDPDTGAVRVTAGRLSYVFLEGKRCPNAM